MSNSEISCIFELTIDLHTRSTVIEETRVIVIAISVDPIELRF